jgi:Flp pilus assembly protein TadG
MAKDTSGRRGLRRREKETGAVLVEFALVVPLLFLILFGIIDFSLVMFSYISVRQGTSAGAREAAVIGTTTLSAQSCTMAPLTTSGASTDATNLLCYTKNHIGLNQSKARVSIWFSTTGCNSASGQPQPCYSAGVPVVVCTQYPASSTTHFFSSLLSNIVLTSKVEIRVENADSSMTPIQETTLNGSPWPSSCSSP